MEGRAAGAITGQVEQQNLYAHETINVRPVPAKRIRMLFGGFLYQANGALTDNLGREANIIVTDVFAANGVIHAIDAVVLPYAP